MKAVEMNALNNISGGNGNSIEISITTTNIKLPVKPIQSGFPGSDPVNQIVSYFETIEVLLEIISLI